MLKFISALDKDIQKIEQILTYIIVALILVMMLLGTADVVGRYVFNSPIKGALEINELLLAALIFLGWGYVQSSRSNIRLEFFINKYRQKAKQVVELIILLITLILFILIAWQSYRLAMLDLSYGRLIENVYIPAFPFKFLITFGAIMVCLESIIQIAYQIRDLRRKEEVN